MPAYDVAEVMQLFYARLAEMGLKERTPGMPDRWEHAEGQGLQVWISHSGFSCQIRYRRKPGQNPTDAHAIQAQEDWERRQPWNELHRSHGGTSQDFARWLGQTAQTIETAGRAYGVIEAAPGE